MSENTANNRLARPPIVVVMGHIDHGKSTLLDFIRKSDIVSGEAGGITQHVGAYQVVHVSADGKKHPITFLDTPGHEAFCSIRERGSKAADIAILVVSAEDGVKPQTLEAYAEIKHSGIPYVVAINKIDKPNANIDLTKQSLGEHEIYVEGWGGDVPCVPISAQIGTGVSELLDMVILVADIADLKACYDVSATGIIVESELDTRKGISATVIVKDGTLKTGSFLVAGEAFSPVRYIDDVNGVKINQATPSMPIVIVGWNIVPVCGDLFHTVSTKKEAEKNIKEFSLSKVRKDQILTTKIDSENSDEKNAVITLPLIIKTDSVGSLDGVKFELAKIKHDRVQVKIIAEGIGHINENDVKKALSDVENITLIGFNAEPDGKASSIIERMNVKSKNFSIIYELTQYVRDSLLSKVPKEFIEESSGIAKILAVFSKEKDRQVIGGMVESGTISLGNDVRIMRRGTEIGRGKIRELQEKKLRARDVAEGHEFGVMVEAKTEIVAGDRIESVRMIEKKS